MSADYYTVLSRAIGALERDSFVARDALYNRARRLLHDNLRESGSTDDYADAEKAAFEDAILRIEFERVPHTVSGADGTKTGADFSKTHSRTPATSRARGFRFGFVPILATSLVAAFLIAGGFLFAQKRANEVADQKVRATLFESELGRFLRVEEIRAGLFDQTIALKEVEFRFPESQLEPIKAKEILISDFKKFGDTVIQLRVNISGFKGSITGDGNFPALLRDVGFPILEGSISVAYNYDVNHRALQAHISYEISNFHRADVRFALNDFDIRTFAAIAGTIRSYSPNDNLITQLGKWVPIWTSFVDALVDMKMSDAAYTLRDLGFQKRFWNILSKRENWTGTISEFSEQKVQPLQPRLTTELEKIGYSQEAASNLSEKLMNYIKYGGEIRFTSKISRPFGLFARDGKGGIVPYNRTPQQLVEISAAEFQWSP